MSKAGGTVVAFLQNMWLRDPEKARRLIAKYGESYRRRLIRYALFAGCLTGRRLRAAFGPAVCEEIVWEEATQEIAGNSRKVCPPEPEHIRAVLEKHQPAVVITFGRVAGDAVAEIWGGKLIRCVHPAARQKGTVERLAEVAEELDRIRKGLGHGDDTGTDVGVVRPS